MASRSAVARTAGFGSTKPAAYRRCRAVVARSCSGPSEQQQPSSSCCNSTGGSKEARLDQAAQQGSGPCGCLGPTMMAQPGQEEGLRSALLSAGVSMITRQDMLEAFTAAGPGSAGLAGERVIDIAELLGSLPRSLVFEDDGEEEGEQL